MNCRSIILHFLIIFLGVSTQAQTSLENDSTERQKLKIIFIKKLKNKETAMGRFQELIGNVHLRQQNMDIFCDSGYIFPQKDLRAFGHVKMIQPSHRLYADSLFYNGLSKTAKLRSNVKLVDSTMRLYAQLLNYNANTQISIFPKGSIIQSDTATLTSKKGLYFGKRSLAVFSKNVIVYNQNFRLTADSLSYNTKTDISYFHSPTHVYHDSIYIYCEDGYYDSKNDRALLVKNTRFENRDPANRELATGDTIYYEGKLKQYFLMGQAMYENDQRRVWADTILYNDRSKEYTFKGKTRFEDLENVSSNQMRANYSSFNQTTKEMSLSGDVVLIQTDFQLYTDSLLYNTQSTHANARGSTLVIDSATNISIHCNHLIKNDSFTLATKNPMIQWNGDQDTLWIVADTIFSESRLDSIGNESRNIIAYHHVEVWKGNIKVRCDSLYYDGKDSSFYFYYNPIMWVDSIQFTAQLLRIKMKNGRIDSLFLDTDAFVVSSSLGHYYNQIKGDSIQTLFNESKLDRMHVTKNGETVYYVLDEKNQYIGVNDIDCTDMTLFFSDKSIRSIRFENKPTAIMYPLRQVDHTTLILNGFQWLIDSMPIYSTFLVRKNPISRVESSQ